MQIPVVAGKGRGRTALSAFDAALSDCGVLNYNLIRLSSVIPPGTTVFELDRACAPQHEHGDRLFVVMAEQRSTKPGRAIAAGIGWYQWQGGRGVFVEHEAEGASTVEVEAEVLDQIYASLGDLCETRRVDFDGLRVGWRLTSAEVGEEPAAVVVLAVYGAERW
ncbi:MAG: arginine decarboxylase [Thermomicrobiales bacterium]|nr:arginine decarboxylase [Thermomicrobiales bacterium]